MPVERLPCDPELVAERTDVRLALAHARHREPEFCRRHFRLAAPDASTRAGGRKAGQRALAVKLALELGETCEEAEDEFAGGRRRVDRRALAGQHPESNSAAGEIIDGVDQVAEIAPEPVEFPHDKRVALAKRLQARREAWSLVELAGRRVAVDVPLADAGG